MKQRNTKFIAILMLSFLCLGGSGDKTKNVLIIGDSISIGYTPFVEKALAPDVIVEHNPGNGGSTIRGIDSVEKWLDNKQWEVIIFNFGLHDLVYKDQEGKYDVLNGKVSVPLEEYKKNLEFIVAKLRETTATLIFVNTTMVPENSIGRKVDDPAKYNAVALEVMKTNDIEVVDLYSASLTIHPQNSQQGNVHYTSEGYEQLASHILKAIKAALLK